MLRFFQLLIALIFTLPIIGVGQRISGRVVNDQTLEAIPYVNIGILHGENGTVSDESGYFQLDLSGTAPDATLRFSFIGYENRDVVTAEISRRCSSRCEIRLIPKVLKMQEVVVYPREYLDKVVGNPNPLKNAAAGFTNDSLGYEMGIRVKIKKQPTLLKELRLHGLDTSYDTVFYRLNVYEMMERKPAQNILHEPIYITLAKNQNGELEVLEPRTQLLSTSDELIVIDLNPYHIMVQDDFVIALEYVRELGEGQLQIRTGFLSGKTFYRKTSQAEWHSIPLGLGMSVLVRYQK